MSGLSVVEMPSALPAACFLIPLLAGFAVLAGGRLGFRWCQLVTMLAAGVMALSAVAMASETWNGAVLTTWGNELRVDALSALVVLIVAGVGVLASAYSIRYMEHAGAGEGHGPGARTRRMPLFHALVLWFLGTMGWAAVTNNIIMLWAAVEATTLSSGLLVAFFWDRRALEAGYKYMMLLTVGITFALFGCVVVYASAAATGGLSGREALPEPLV